MQENIKSIPGYENLYEISDLGNVYSVNYGNQGKKRQLIPVLVNGYLKVNLCAHGKRRRFSIHRLVILTFNGNSILNVDHVDGNRLNNKLSNLRYVTVQQNAQNHYKHKNGFCGASWCKRDKKWKSTMRINGKQKTLGYFKTKEEAIEKYQLTLKALQSNVDA